MSQLLTLAGWAFLPGFITDMALSTLHKIFPSRLPARGTQQYDTLKRLIFAVAVVAYLGYNVYDTVAGLDSNLYDVLNVPLDADEKLLRSSFRRMSAKYHPDKATGDELMFRRLRVAYDTLSDVPRRFGYDRFGLSVVDWSDMRTPFDYLQRGLTGVAPFYLGSAVLIFGLSWLRGDKYGAFWRGVLFVALTFAHFAVLFGDLQLRPLSWLLPNGSRRTSFEMMEVLKQLVLNAMVAVSQVGPILFPGTAPVNQATEIAELASLSRVLMVEADQTRQLARLPFLSGTTNDHAIIDATTEWMARARLDAEPEVQVLRNRDASP